jgi:hypothetical protein
MNSFDGLLEDLGKVEQTTKPTRYRKPNMLKGDRDA